jgi:hypothetical protein
MNTQRNLRSERKMRRAEGVPPLPGSSEPPSDDLPAEARETAAQARQAGWQIANEGDSLHGKITLTIKDRAAKLFREAVEDADSEANTMVHILLLDQIAEIEAERLRQDPRLVLSEERHRGIEYDQQAELSKHRNRKLDAETAKARLEIERLHKQIDKLRQELEAGDLKLKKARRTLEQAKISADLGQPMDAQQVCRRIAEIVGLEDPVQPAAQ